MILASYKYNRSLDEIKIPRIFSTIGCEFFHKSKEIAKRYKADRICPQ